MTSRAAAQMAARIQGAIPGLEAGWRIAYFMGDSRVGTTKVLSINLYR
jgi:hypothetical protein